MVISWAFVSFQHASKDKTEVEENICDEVPEMTRRGAKHDYYYDDAHGYEVYDPDKEEAGEDLVDN